MVIAAQREGMYLNKQRVFDARVHILAKLFNEPVMWRGMREMVNNTVDHKKQGDMHGSFYARPAHRHVELKTSDFVHAKSSKALIVRHAQSAA